MNTLIIASVVVWFASIAFMAWQIYFALEGAEDADGFHFTAPKISRFRHVHLRHPKRTNRLADAFRLAAQSLSRANDAMGQYCRRMKGRLGEAEGIVAVAHKLARIVYAMITTGRAYDEKEAFKVTPSSLAKRLKHLQNQAAALGLQLVAA